MPVTAGYDVGGAHLKVARIEDGRVVAVRVIAMPLWRGLQALDAALADARALTSDARLHAATMTAELTEIFDSRAAGVTEVSSALERTHDSGLRIFMGLKGFGTAAQARENHVSVGSANFLATAQLIAQKQPRSLLIDMGSTTTDVVACDRPQGLSDAERLQTGELVYTGFTRTPVPSVTTRAALAGQWQTLARDAFATMADVRRVIGELPDHIDLHDTADGRGKSVAESLVRLSRGFGRDGEMRHLDVWRSAAACIREAQLRSVHDGALQVLSRPGPSIACVVVAGIGAVAGEDVARRLELPCRRFGDIVEANDSCRDDATAHAAAVAVGLLADAAG